MFGLSFVDAPTVEPAHPARADVALFVGWTTRRANAPLPRAVGQWLRERRYLDEALFTDPARPWQRNDLLDMPVPIDTWQLFDHLFNWHARPVSEDDGDLADDYLGLAVRDFFANGGRKCYVVRLGNPWPVLPQISGERRDAARALLSPERITVTRHWREQWRGIEHAWGLDDVSMVLVPDLPDLFGAARNRVAGSPAQAASEPEVFVECGQNGFDKPAVPGVGRVSAPRLDDDAWAQWNNCAWALRNWFAMYRRDLMLVLALPLAARESRAAREHLGGLNKHSSLLQVASPWFVPTREARVPEGLLPPDGTLAGLIAGVVLSRGAARSAAGQAPVGVLGLEPQPEDELFRRHVASDARVDSLLTRCALFGRTPDGVRLLTDHTTSAVVGWQQAGVVRLLGQLLRTARQVGETLVFEPSGERLWAQVRSRFEDMLDRYWQAGALRGTSAAEAYAVQCDRGVMSQNDIDAGRVVVLIEFAPQQSIERLRVALALAEDGSVQWTDANSLAGVSA